MNAIRLRQQFFHLRCDPQGLHNVIHLFAYAGDNETLHHFVDDRAQRILIRHLSFHREERVFRVCQPILLQKFTAEDRFIDRSAGEPIRPPRLPDNLFLLRLFVFSLTISVVCFSFSFMDFSCSFSVAVTSDCVSDHTVRKSFDAALRSDHVSRRHDAGRLYVNAQDSFSCAGSRRDEA